MHDVQSMHADSLCHLCRQECYKTAPSMQPDKCSAWHTYGLSGAELPGCQGPCPGPVYLAIEVFVPQVIDCAASAPQQQRSKAEQRQQLRIWQAACRGCQGNRPEAGPCKQPCSCAQ